MEPVLPKDCTVVLTSDDDYESGDILAFTLKGLDEILIRKCLINGDMISFIPISNKHDIRTYKLDDVQIVGKVKSIIEDL